MPVFNLESGPAYLLLLAITSFVYLLMVFAMRLFLRLRVNGPFGKDDWACALSTLCGLIYSTVLVAQVFMGLGSETRHLSPPEANQMAIISWVNGIFLTFAGYFSKMSACFLLARITKTREHLAVAYGLMAAMTLWVMQAQIYAVLQCKYPRPWDTSSNNICYGRWGHKLSTAVSSYALELAIVAGTIHMVWDISMPFETKAKVVIAFALRLLIIPPSAVRLGPLHANISNPADSLVRVQVMSLLACQISVISATVPCAKPFFSVFSNRVLGRLRSSILPTSRPMASKETTATGSAPQRLNRDRGKSIRLLHLQPERGMTVTSAEHVPVQTKTQQPPITKPKHSDSSITYHKSFEVSYQDVGGSLDQEDTGGVHVIAKKRCSSAPVFPWRRRSSGKHSSQKSKPDSFQHHE